MVPADARLICDVDNKAGFDEYLAELRAQGEGEPTEASSDDDEKDQSHKGHSLVATDQSAITGESLAVDKYMTDTVYYTTGCKRGRAYAVVLQSARGSFVGRTASLVEGAKDQGHFKAIMNSIGTALLVLVVSTKKLGLQSLYSSFTQNQSISFHPLFS